MSEWEYLFRASSDPGRLNLEAGRPLWSLDDIENIELQQHPLGFVHAVLKREGAYALRLHVWPDSVRYTQHPSWTIHTHRFDLTSFVLTGQLTNKMFSVKNQTASPLQIYEVTYNDTGSILTATDQSVSCLMETCDYVTAGKSYSVEAGRFHETVVPEQTFAATIAVTKDRAEPSPIKVIGRVAGNNRYSYARSAVPPEVRANVVSKLRTCLP